MSIYRPTITEKSTGQKRQSKVWWMDFHVNRQRVRESTGMRSKTMAKRVEEKRKQGIRDGAAGLRKPDAPKLFSIAGAEFIEFKKAKWSVSMVAIANNSMKHLLPIFGRKLLLDIEASDIRKYQQKRLTENASGRTCNIEVGLLRSILKRAGLWARIQPSIEMSPERDNVGIALTDSEERLLLSVCGESRSRILRPFVTLAIETAARYGTIKRLTWKNVDFQNRCLAFGRDKTKAGSGRVIPLTPRALETLRFWSESFPGRIGDHFVFPHERIGGGGESRVFGFTEAQVYETDPTRPVGSIKTAWETARERTRYRCTQCVGELKESSPAGFQCDACGWRTAELPAGVQVRFHDLRHTGVSRMIAARVPLPIIAKIVGWSAGTLAKMSARYGHFSLEELRSAMESVSSKPEETSSGYPNKSPNTSDSKRERLQ
jgi:integrase